MRRIPAKLLVCVLAVAMPDLAAPGGSILTADLNAVAVPVFGEPGDLIAILGVQGPDTRFRVRAQDAAVPLLGDALELGELGLKPLAALLPPPEHRVPSCARRPIRPSTDAAVTWTSTPDWTRGRRLSGFNCTSAFRSG